MLTALTVDALLLLILILLVPVGTFRGGVREVCTAAGVMLGILIAQAWTGRWGGWLADNAGFSGNTARFIAAVTILTVTTLIVGYGAAAAFSYTPGAGGRLYGGLLALVSGVVFLGAVAGYVRDYLYEGESPDIIRDSYVARALTNSTDWILLLIAGALTLATLFGAFVRERDYDDSMEPVPRATPVVPARKATPVRDPEPVKLEPEAGTTRPLGQRTAAVRVKEIRHWEEPTVPPQARSVPSGDGWTQSWPEAGSRITTPSAASSAGDSLRDASGESEEAALRDWLAENGQTGEPRNRSRSDE